MATLVKHIIEKAYFGDGKEEYDLEGDCFFAVSVNEEYILMSPIHRHRKKIDLLASHIMATPVL